MNYKNKLFSNCIAALRSPSASASMLTFLSSSHLNRIGNQINIKENYRINHYYIYNNLINCAKLKKYIYI